MASTKRIVSIAGLTIAIVIAGLWAVKLSVPRLRIEGYTGLFFRLMTNDEDTRSAPGYSDKKFLQIKVGMTEQQVLEILGEPLERWTPYGNVVGFQYTESPRFNELQSAASKFVRRQSDRKDRVFLS